MLTEQGALSVRWYKPDDYRQLCALHRECYPNERWEQSDFEHFLSKKNHRHNRIKVLVGESPRILGAALYTIVDTTHIDISHVAIFPEQQRRGFGTYLMRRLINSCSRQRRGVVFKMDVRESNVIGQCFLRHLVFVLNPADILRGFYENPKEDCYPFRYENQAASEKVSSNAKNERN